MSDDRSSENVVAQGETRTQITAAYIDTLPILQILMLSNDFTSSTAVLQSRKINECMAAMGFDYRLPDASSTVSNQSEAEVLARRYGAPIERSDGLVGYAFDSPREPTPQVEEPAASPQESDALVGKPLRSALLTGSGGEVVGEVSIGDGCVGQSLQEIFGSADDYIRYAQMQAFVDSVSSSSLSRLYSDPDATELSRAWAECMATSGFAYRTPFEISNQDWPSPRPGPKEQQIARTDQLCRSQTGIDSQLAALDASYQTELLTGAEDLVDELLGLYKVTIARAAN